MLFCGDERRPVIKAKRSAAAVCVYAAPVITSPVSPLLAEVGKETKDPTVYTHTEHSCLPFHVVFDLCKTSVG